MGSTGDIGSDHRAQITSQYQGWDPNSYQEHTEWDPIKASFVHDLHNFSIYYLLVPLDVDFLASAGKNNERGDGKKNEIPNAVGGWIVHYHISFPTFLVLLSVQND